MMRSMQLLQWFLWAFSLLMGSWAISSLFKLRIAERFLPPWNELKRIEPTLAAKCEELRHLRESIQVRQQELGQLEATIGHLRMLKEWQDANPEAPARIQQMIADLERYKSELAAIQQKLAQEEVRLNEIAREVQRLIQEKTQLVEQIPPLRDQVTALHGQKTDLESTLRDLDSRRLDLQRQVDKLLEQRADCQKNLDDLYARTEEVESQRRTAIFERDQARAERDVARAELAGLQKSIEQLKELAKGMQVNLEKAGVTTSEGYVDLFVPVFRDENGQPHLPPRASIEEERIALERTRDYIRSKGLIFPERVLYAFHTSLKINDISPLVVLAGISGTGKSELPRHYADGMGIHFLLVAVQPRWDSPQDLFGFYNYLEKRYKATELARALVQFERFNQNDWEFPKNVEIDDRSDRMLLVLLDEMNLARTEYYFSELLSKLETRRMVNEKAPQDRARAEIELDMGSLLNGRKSLRLYPGRNVLFAGTMNEDESTQALSDKVIDRASVLRFWRPKKTHLDTIGTAGKQVPAKNGLTFENWNHWLRKFTDLSPYASDVDKWIEQLNDSLTQVGRPFAFRVDRAIRSYIANYPRWVANWHKHAMADQIEQRIFPKLRGIEPDLGQAPTALQTIARIIDQLEDEALKEAFEGSWKEQPTFLFRGVLRDERE